MRTLRTGLSALAALFPGIFISALLFTPRVVSAETAGTAPETSITISFDLEGKTVEGRSVITFHAGRETLIRTGSLKIKSVAFNGRPFTPAYKQGSFTVRAEEGNRLEIEYTCVTGSDSPCIMEERGIFLSGDWYPSPDGLGTHRLTALVPDHFTAVSEAETVTTEKRPGGTLYSFSFEHPVEGLTFIACRYITKKDTFRAVELYAYFFPGDEVLADTYLEHAKNYLGLYEGIAGRFPFRRFSVVENFLPTGISVPTFTLLGQDVVRLPFIVRTSLGHEILHQWLGNSVYVDYGKGNWSEGFTTYLSDHLYEEREGRGWQYRKQILIDYRSYVMDDSEFPLKDFRARTGFGSRAIGYGKGAMVFHMLRKLAGEEVFWKAVRKFIDSHQFRKASWDDIRVAFESESGKDLRRFFETWLGDKGFPSIEVKEPEIGPAGLEYAVSLEVLQKEKEAVFALPVRVGAAKGDVKQVLAIEGKKQGFSMVTGSPPDKLVIDEDYDVFRKLAEKETPPVIGRLLGEEKGILVLPPEEQTSVYAGLIALFEGKGYTKKKPAEVTAADLRDTTLVIVDAGNPLVKRLFARTELPARGFSVTVRKNPFNSDKVVAIANALSREETEAALGKISHYGKYSMVSFDLGKNIDKKIDESDRGWIMQLREPITGLRTSDTLGLADIARNVSAKKIVYLGEQHDRYEHHVSQFETIKELYVRNNKIAIGMEMFQRPFQKALDDYIAGTIEEREFLRSSEYFKRWGFDYNLYKDILRFARQEKIPVVALNIRREIVDKVSKQGIEALTEEERKELPDAMDMTDEDYRKRLKETFEGHDAGGGMDFTNFYQSQIIWDETMASSIDEYLKKNPDRQMVVLVGGGHLVFGSGIPKRAFRRNGLDYSILLNSDSVEKEIADYILFPQSLTVTKAPKLMVVLKVEDKQVKVIGFGEGSVAEKAGIRKDDIILALDGDKVNSVEDMQIFLFYKKKGETITVTVLRKRFLFGSREMRIEVTL
jgi:uncharacterized iron-regulated protein